jgi:hypothetical protein
MMNKESLNEPPATNVIFQYDHFCPGDDKFKGLREQFPEYAGICWFACLVMASQALHPEKSQLEIISDLQQTILNLKRNDILDILEETRRQGIKTENFWKGGQLEFIHPRRGGLHSDFARQHPEDFANFVNFIFKKFNLGVSLDVIPLVAITGSTAETVEKFKSILYEGKIVILPALVVDDEHKQIQSGHVVLIAGIENGAFIVSDPNFDNKQTIPFRFFHHYLNKGVKLSSEETMFLATDFYPSIFVISRA